MKGSITAVLAAVLLMTCTAACGDADFEIQKRYKELTSYTALMEVTVTGNKGAETYTLSQSWRAPEQRRTEVVAPEHLKGTVSVESGGAMWFRSCGGPALQMERGTAAPETDYLCLSDFFQAFFGREAETGLTPDAEGLVLLDAPCAPAGRYRFDRKLWIDSRSWLPSKMTVCGADGNEIIRVEYRDFVPNAKLEDALFLP